MCGSSNNKLTRLFCLLEFLENMSIDSDTFFATSITVENCIRTDLYQNDVNQVKWIVLVNLTNTPGSILLSFFDLRDTSNFLIINFTTSDDSPAKG